MKIFLDGPNIDEIKNIKNINGYTFNPSLFKLLIANLFFKYDLKEILELPTITKIVSRKH